MSKWNMREAYGGVYTDEARALYDRLVSERDTFPALPATSRRTVCTCLELYGSEPCVPDMMQLPAHATCGTILGEDGDRVGGMCWCWTGCDDPDCDHPACAGRGWRRFSDAWEIKHGTPTKWGMTDGTLLWATEWRPWTEKNPRRAELAADHPRHDQAKMLRQLERGTIHPVRLGADYLGMIVALLDRGVPLEDRTVAYVNEVSVAYHVARGEPFEELGGGAIDELRLAEAVELDAAPDGYQGALFA